MVLSHIQNNQKKVLFDYCAVAHNWGYYPIAEAVAEAVAVEHPIAEAVAEAVAVEHPIAEAVAEAVAVEHPTVEAVAVEHPIAAQSAVEHSIDYSVGLLEENSIN